MEMRTEVPLKNLTTMKLGGNARYFVEVKTITELAEICHKAKNQFLPVFILGGGSNVIAKDEGFDGVVIRVCIPGFEILADDTDSTTIKIGAGENWDQTVEKIVKMGLSGVEAMSGIPGTAGAAPVQNVGAYGQEIADTFQSLEAYDIQSDSFVTLNKSDCKFGYRCSIFRGEATGRYIITSITIKLPKKQPQPPFYDALQKYFDANDINSYTSETIRNAVIDIRKNKLPDPDILPNSGSFFKNAIIDADKLESLRTTYPSIPVYDMGNRQYKIPTGWLIEQAGLKGSLSHGMRIYDKNALVLVNESAKSYADLSQARDEIIGRINDIFQVSISQEPLEIY